MAVSWAEYPQRKCREQFMISMHVDLTCDLPDGHPGPPASQGSKPSIDRREAWEAANPGWEKTAKPDDPFVELRK